MFPKRQAFGVQGCTSDSLAATCTCQSRHCKIQRPHMHCSTAWTRGFSTITAYSSVGRRL